MTADVQTIGEVGGVESRPLTLPPRTVSGFDVGAWWKALKVSESPVVPLPESALVDALVGTAAGRAELVAMLQRREELIGAMREDPLRYGWKPWFWKRAEGLLGVENELLILGGNRSSKTEFAAYFAMRSMVEKPGSWWAFLHSSADSSKRQQQPRIYRYFPPEWRNLGKKGSRVYVNWTEKNGFMDGVFILPNGSRAYFFNYMQDKAVLEGDEWDGAWCDELVPVDFVEALRWRMVTRKGKLIVTFTPVAGYSSTVGKFLAGAKVIETRPSPLLADKVNVKDCPAGTMPFVLQSSGGRGEGLTGTSSIICFFTEWNPYNPYEEAVKKLIGEQERVVKMRAYGWPEKAGGVAFPKFGSVHVVKRTKGERTEDLGLRTQLGKVSRGDAEGAERETKMGFLTPPRPWENLYRGRLPWRGTNYRVADPAPLKNWVIKWYRCDELGRVFLYREWPDWGSHGAWAIAGKKADGDEGPAQRAGFGKGIRDYKRIILEAEGWVWREEGEGLRTELKGLSGEGSRGGAEGAERRGLGGGYWDGRKAEVIMGSVMDPRGGGAAVPSDEKATSILQLLNETQVDEAGRMVGPSLDFREARGLRVGEGLDQFREWLTFDESKPVDALNCPKFYVVEDCEQSIYALREYTGLDGEKGMLKDVIDPDRYFRTTPGLCFVGENDLGSFGGGGY